MQPDDTNTGAPTNTHESATAPERAETAGAPVRFTTAFTTKLTHQERRELARAGYAAAYDDELTAAACPYRWDPNNPDEPVDHDKARAWLSGHAAGITDLRIFRDSTPQAERDERGEPGQF